MGEHVRVHTPDGVKVEKTTDAMLEKIRELVIHRDALIIEVAELRALEAIHARSALRGRS